MTLETFFEKFDQFTDAPDAVAKMRELSANGAPHTSLGQRPRNNGPQSSQALKGRNNPPANRPRGFPVWMFWSPLQGWHGFAMPYPGRCPGLVWDAALRLEEPLRDAGNLL